MAGLLSSQCRVNLPASVRVPEIESQIFVSLSFQNFDSMSEIPKLYDPAAAQSRWFPFWEQHGYFNAEPGTGKPQHTIMIPLPNVTGALHMGHALNSTCQDLINRWRRMQGYEALWMPGTDHAGIATQAVVERRMLEEEGLTRHDIGRDALVNRIWRWKDAYEKRILSQLKSIGDSCDWRRTRFTLDDVCARAVRRTFFNMFRDGLIYRGKRLVNWDVHLQTAVADDEVFEEDTVGHFWTFNYPVADAAGCATGESIRFSTTRPETMLGDTAVCVHPTDERYTHLIGKQVQIPVSGRFIPIIADALLADKELGTGAVKVTPAHDPNDYACYTRKLGQPDEIEIINILNSDGTLNEFGGIWQGMDRLAVRPLVVERMAELGHFEEVEDRVIPLKHSDRSKTPVEPYLSDQWFVRMGEFTNDDGRTFDLAQSSIDAVEQGQVRFYPSRYARTYLDWLSEKRDWCISRQLWWGHRIPVWSQTFSTPEAAVECMQQLEEFADNDGVQISGEFEEDEEGMFVGESTLTLCIADGLEEIEQQAAELGFVQDPDVLDTWFSSALWPHATLGWPDLEHNPPLDPHEVAKQTACTKSQSRSETDAARNDVLREFYPSPEFPDARSVLITSRDIITLWVARMVLTGIYNRGHIPFRHVHVHPKILDGFGQTMSKSKGNGVDPVDLINKYGTDAVRFTIASFAGETQDVKLPISYECPKCETLIPQTLKHQSAKPEGGPKPTVYCPKCKADYQYTSPNYDPDPDAPVARMVSERFEYGRNFCNKFWNAARFAMMNLEDYLPGNVTADQLQLEDRWILSRLSTTAQAVNEYLGRYQFDAATRAVRDFTWNEFCDWYLEMVKPRLRRNEAEAESPAAKQTRETAQRVLLCVLDSLVRLLQPFAPFICEELWQRLKEIAPVRALPIREDSSKNSHAADAGQPGSATLILKPATAADAAIVAQWPQIPAGWQDAALEKRFERLQETIVAVRNVRAIYKIPQGSSVKLLMRASAEVAGDMHSVAAQFDNLAKAVLEAAGADVQRPTGAASFTLDDADGFIPLAGLVDTQAELARQQKEAEKIRKAIAGSEARLSNEGFLSKAKEEVIAAMRETLEGYKKQLKSIEDTIADLS